jgi:hypothetical protein
MDPAIPIMPGNWYYRFMANEGSEDILGRKLFFLYPSALIQNQIIAELIQQEYEVYIVKDHVKLRRILKNFPNSIIFANIYEGLTEKEWEAWIAGVMGAPELAGISVGIVCSGDDENLKRKYLLTLKIQCGYTVLKSDLTVALKSLTEILMAADAKGRRKYLRADTSDETRVTVNFPLNGTFVNGRIKDISVVGFSCTFDDDPELTKNVLFQDIQIKLQTNLLKAEGIVFGFRTEGETKIYVVLFTQRIDPSVRTRIRKYIQQNLQSKMDLLLG